MFDAIESHCIDGTTLVTLHVPDDFHVLYAFVFADEEENHERPGEVYAARVDAWDAAETEFEYSSHTC